MANTPRMDFCGIKAFLMGLSVCCGEKGKKSSECLQPRKYVKFNKPGHYLGNDPDTGKDLWQEEKGTTEDEMVGGITD